MIKVYFHNFKDVNLRYFFPTRILFQNFKVRRVFDEAQADVIFEAIARGSTFANSKKKVVFFSADNLKFKKNFFSCLESAIFRVGFKNKYKIMDSLDKILPPSLASIPLVSFFPQQEKLLKEVLSNKVKNKFFIVTNKFDSPYCFSLPFFIQTYYDKLPSLLSKHNHSNKKKFCAFIVSSNSSRERVMFFKKLSKYKRVDSFGKVMNNMGKDNNANWKNNPLVFSKYKFVICFENSFNEDTITEKLPNAMLSGAIPIYRGAPNIHNYFNTASFINFENYGSYKKIIEKIIELDTSSCEYKKMAIQPWFNNGHIPSSIKNKEKKLIKFYEKILNEKTA